MRRLSLQVRGHVQGVGFRFWVQRVAAELGLPGRAVNNSDGSVSILVEGPEADCQRLLERVKGAEAPGQVDSVDPQWQAPADLRGFRIG